jgi:hypothetical protein
MNNKKVKIILLVLIILIVFIIVIKNKSSNKSNIQNTIIFNNKIENLNYSYDEENKTYTIYDENGNQRGITNDESKLKLFIDNPDYNEENTPLDFSNYSNAEEETKEDFEE